MADIQPPVKPPSERYFRMSRENFEEFLKKIGYKEREDKKWERSRKGTSKGESVGVVDEQQILDIDELFKNKKKLRSFISRHWAELPPPPP